MKMTKKQLIITIVASIIGTSIGRYYSEKIAFEQRKMYLIESIKESASENYSSFIITERENK